MFTHKNAPHKVRFLVQLFFGGGTSILDMSKSAFSDALFKTQIYQRERIKKFTADGIKDTDMHDKKSYIHV